MPELQKSLPMLNILFVTQDDPFYIPCFFEEFANILDDQEIAVWGVVIQAPLGQRSYAKLLKRMYDFYGPIDFCRMTARYVSQLFVKPLKQKLFPKDDAGLISLTQIIARKKWKVISTADVNSSEFLEMIRPWNLDLIVSVAASQVFKSGILSLPRYGCINIHNSKLPKNRGMLPNFWALLDSDLESTSAMTVHKMNERLDDGDIVLQEEFPLDRNESLHDLIVRTKRLNAHLVLKTIKLFKKGEPVSIHNDARAATYHTFPTKDDVRLFRSKGLRLL